MRSAMHTAELTFACILEPGEGLDSDRVKGECGSMVSSRLHGLWEAVQLRGNEDFIGDDIRDVWEQYRDYVAGFNVPREAAGQLVHRGHCTYLPAEERRFVTPAMIRASGALVGTPEQILDMLREKEANGLKEVVLCCRRWPSPAITSRGFAAKSSTAIEAAKVEEGSVIPRLAAWIAGVLVVAVLVFLSAPIDPMGRIAGTRLGGPPAADQDPTWTDYGRRQIAVETRTAYGIRHSVTTTSWVADGNLYVPCARCDGKRWPANVARDNRVRLKIDGEIYRRHASSHHRRPGTSPNPHRHRPRSRQPHRRVPHGTPLSRSKGSLP